MVTEDVTLSQVCLLHSKTHGRFFTVQCICSKSMSEKYKSTDVQDLLPDKILVFSKLCQFFFDICYPLVDVLSFLLNAFQLNVVFQFASPDLQKPQFPTQYSDQFSSDMEHIPWDTINLMESVDEKLDAFNDLFLAGLDNHAPIKTVKLR